MLGAPRYLLGVLEVLLLIGSAGLGATQVRRRLVPAFSGAPAFLATIVLAAALLILVAELLGSFGAFKALPYLLTVGALGVGSWTLLRQVAPVEGCRERTHGPPAGPPRPAPGSAGRGPTVPILIALAIAAIALLHFADAARLRLDTGMTGFDSTWYHGPFAAGFFQSGNTWDLHFIAPQFLAWFYPANAEIFHAAGMLAFGRDILSPLLNIGWFCGCLLAAWCVGRPYRVAPWSLALAAVALSLPTLADQAGEARSDLAGTFFLLAAVAIAVNAWAAGAEESPSLPSGSLVLAGLAAGLAAGTKLNFLLPCAALIVGLAVIAPRGGRWRALLTVGLAALAGGGYWYLRNLLHTGNPLPWFDHLGPLSLPSPAQELGGRETHPVLGYLTDGSVWSRWFLPGLHHGLGLLWPLVVLGSLAGLLLCLGGRRAGPLQRVLGVTGLLAALAWLVAPTSASGPEGMPSGFESGLRYLAPAIVLGLALLPTAPLIRSLLLKLRTADGTTSEARLRLSSRRRLGRSWVAVAGLVIAGLVVAVGYPVQRHYLQDRYANPSFTTPGLNSAFRWARSVSGARIATTSTRQYPLFGTDLSNQVQFVGESRPHGGFVAPATCRAWRRAIDAGDYDYVVASRDRVEPGKPPYPLSARWAEGPNATVVLAVPPTKVFKLEGTLDPSTCPS